MSVLIDTNVIIDIVTDDPEWAGWSDRMIQMHRPSGILINAAIFAELSAGTDTEDEVDEIIRDIKLSYQEIPKTALFYTGQAFRTYRAKGGTRTSPLADFFIGAHAKALGIPLITRDTKRYRTYFPEVPLITPDPA